MKVLLYLNKKIDPVLIDATNEGAAILALFRFLDREFEAFRNECPESPRCKHCGSPHPSSTVRDRIKQAMDAYARDALLIEKARDRNVAAAERLLTIYAGDELFRWCLFEVKDPRDIPGPSTIDDVDAPSTIDDVPE